MRTGYALEVKRCYGGCTIRNGFGRPYRLDRFVFALVCALTHNVHGLFYEKAG